MKQIFVRLSLVSLVFGMAACAPEPAAEPETPAPAPPAEAEPTRSSRIRCKAAASSVPVGKSWYPYMIAVLSHSPMPRS